MTISLITDGMLDYRGWREAPRAPDDIEAHFGPVPHSPCAPEGDLEPAPPQIPQGAEATGPAVPHVPCGPTGEDPTIKAPKIPSGSAGGDVPDHPAKPRCSRGDKI